MKKFLALTLTCGFFLFAAGCEDAVQTGPPQVYPVRGQVLYNGKPVEGIVVTLFPTDAPMIPRIPQNPAGTTDASGNFTIMTFTKDDGAAEGGYQVLLRYPKTANSEVLEVTSDDDQFLGWYDAMHSTLSVRIKPEANQLDPFKVPLITRPADAVQGIPGRN